MCSAQDGTDPVETVDGARRGLAAVAVIIPAWQPDGRLIELVTALRESGFGALIVVDDGSTPDHAGIFAQVARVGGAVVLRNRSNKGKGSALKKAFRYVLEHRCALEGVVTADADGQHTPVDVVRVAEALLRNPGRPVLGARRFNSSVPLRSRLGNAVTRRIFQVLTGVSLGDTQTGLRGLPFSKLEWLSTLDGERYEYEMVMLARLCRDHAKPVEVKIETVYLEGNRSSHFRPLRDSRRIYASLGRVWLRNRFGERWFAADREQSRLGLAARIQ